MTMTQEPSSDAAFAAPLDPLGFPDDIPADSSGTETSDPEASAAEIPTAEEPAATETPAAEEPAVAEEPAAETLSNEEPVAPQEPATEQQSVTQELDEVASEKPAVDDATSEAPAAPQSADQAEDQPESSPAEPASEPAPPALSGFAALGLDRSVTKVLDELGYQEPTPIQLQAIPHLLSGEDLLGQAATGTGKTAAFSLPMLHHIGPDARKIPTGLILVPTRELAMQATEAIKGYGRLLNTKVLAIYGGQPIRGQIEALNRGVHVVVATPGRAIDHINRGTLRLDNIEMVVLDEADEMLDMGFAEDIEAILEKTPAERQTALFSATLPHRIAQIAKKHQKNPVRVQIKTKAVPEGERLVRQDIYVVDRRHKPAALGRILDLEQPTSAIIFCGTRVDVDELTVTMNNRGYRAEALHGGMDQQQRDRVMGRLRDGTAQLLVATDVAARGLDVDALSHVVNYDVPTAAEIYVHRIGRVGRAGRTGVAITLATPRSKGLLRNIEGLIRQELNIKPIPTAAELRKSRRVSAVAEIRQLMEGGELAIYEDVLDTLADDASYRDIALAALALADKRGGIVDDSDYIPDASFDRGRSRNDRFSKRRDRPRDARGGRDRGGRDERGGRDARGDGRDRDDRPRNDRSQDDRGRGGFGGGDADTGFVYIGVGKRGGIRPGDLVGAIAGESGLPGKKIGPIRISEHYSVVGVPKSSVNKVIDAVKSTKIKGKKAKARRFEE